MIIHHHSSLYEYEWEDNEYEDVYKRISSIITMIIGRSNVIIPVLAYGFATLLLFVYYERCIHSLF